MSIFDPINRTFGGFNQRVSGLGLPGGLGLLQAGTDILGGQPIGQAVRGGLQTFQSVSQLDEERKRKALLQKLISEGGFTPQEQALIAATPSQNQASVAAQIRAQKAAANKPNAFQQRKTIGEQQGLLGDALQRFILTGELPKETNFELVPEDQVEDLGFPKGTVLQKNTISGDIDVLQSAPTTPTTFKYLSKSQKRDLGFNENSVVQINNQTKQVTVVKEAPKKNEKFTILTADEVAKAGYPEGTIVQKSDLTGKQNIIQSVPNKDSSKLTLTKSELLAQGFNEGDVVQKDEDTGALTVVRSAEKPETTSLMTNYKFIKELKPEASDKEIFSILNNKTTFNLGKNFEIQGDYVVTEDPDSATGFKFTAIPGSPADLRQKNAKLKEGKVTSAEQTKTEAQATSGTLVLEEIDRAIKAIESNPRLTTGLGAQLTENIAGTPAADVKQLLAPIQANIGFDRLQRMRDESPTGGALGQVAVKELDFLQATQGSLSQLQTSPQLLENLKRLSEQYKSSMLRIYRAALKDQQDGVINTVTNEIINPLDYFSQSEIDMLTSSEDQPQGSFSERLNSATTVKQLNDLAASPNLTATDRDAIMKKLEELF